MGKAMDDLDRMIDMAGGKSSQGAVKEVGPDEVHLVGRFTRRMLASIVLAMDELAAEQRRGKFIRPRGFQQALGVPE